MSTLTPTAASDLFRTEPSRFLDVGAGEVAYRTVGTGPDVLFVPGWPVSGATYRQLLPHLAEHVTCHLIDFPGTGSSRFTANTPMSLDQHVVTLQRVIDQLGFDDVAVVGQDSGGMIARHAMAGDRRVRSMGLINTEQPVGISMRFKMFLAGRRVPGFGKILGWAAGQPRVRRNKFVFGDAFADRTNIDGEFDEFFLQPLHTSPAHIDASVRLLRSFTKQHVTDLAAQHRKITCPVHLVWGVHDPFFPVDKARSMVDTFANARITEIAGASLFPHEERPAEVAAALLPTLLGTS